MNYTPFRCRGKNIFGKVTDINAMFSGMMLVNDSRVVLTGVNVYVLYK